MYKLDNFKTCCDYLGIDNTLPVCQIDERKIQAAYKLRVCMRAWNKHDEFEPDEKTVYCQKDVGYTPFFYFEDGKLLSSGSAINGSYAGFALATANTTASIASASIGLRLSLKTRDRAIDFGKTFSEIFNELI